MHNAQVQAAGATVKRFACKRLRPKTNTIRKYTHRHYARVDLQTFEFIR